MANIPQPKRMSWQTAPKRYDNHVSSFDYKQRRWRNLSLQYRIDNPLCVLCKALGIPEPATCTDHITPISMGGNPWDIDNMQSLCDHHHSIKTMKEVISRQRAKTLNNIKGGR